jgi:hypothetical protein
MAVYLSPGVFPREIDLSVLPAAVGPLRPAFVGTAKRGPLNTPVYISSSQQALDTFGEPFAESYLMYAVLAYLEEGNQCYVVRVGVEYEVGQDDPLSSVAISTDGSKNYGWGRIPVFTGIDYGKIDLRSIDAQNPIDFHPMDISTPVYTNVNYSPTDGPPTATMAVTGPYIGSTDDSYLIVITSDPKNKKKIDGATYEVYNNGGLVAGGIITDANYNGTSDSIEIDSANGLTAVITVVSGTLNINDTFTFQVVADNRKFQFSVEGIIVGSQFTMPTEVYDNVDDFVAAFNNLLSSQDYLAVKDSRIVNGMMADVPVIRTDQPGKWIQLVGTQSFALSTGVQQYTWDTPRAFLLGAEEGPYTINSTNNRIKLDVVGPLGTVSAEFNVPNGGAQSAASIAHAINSAGFIEGQQVFKGIALEVPGNRDLVLIMTADPDVSGHSNDALVMRANYSYVRTLKFAQTLNIPYPYKREYRGFTDSRNILPDGSSTDPAITASCDLNPSSDQCVLDSSYYQNIVGFFVATSAGTWISSYRLNVSLYTDAVDGIANRYVVSVTDSAGIAIEKFTDVTFDKTTDRYIGNFLNPGSKYGGTAGAKTLNWEERPSYLDNDPTMPGYVVRNPSSLNLAPFTGQQNGIPTDPAYSSAVDAAVIGNASTNSGLYAFQNKDSFDINLLCTPGYSTGAVIAAGLSICESRGDVLYIIDPPFGLRPQQVVDWHNGMYFSDLSNAINSSYGALYWGWIRYYDQFNIQEVWVPPSGHIAAIFSRTARVTEQWYAPAGLTRGRVLTALEIEYTPTQGENDLLYGSGNSVNPICKFPQDGIVVWGNRTLQRVETSLSRVNVRMLLIYLKKVLGRTLKTFVFEPNDSALWSQVTSVINPLLADIQSRRGITAYKVVVDASNNTPERIDRNELWVSIFIKPTRSVEFIVLNLAVINTGTSFSAEEVLAAGGVVNAATAAL